MKNSRKRNYFNDITVMVFVLFVILDIFILLELLKRYYR